MADNLKFLEREILNKVLNAGEDALNVDLTAGGSAMLVDDAAFTPGTSTVQMVGAEFDDTGPDSVDEGDAGAIRMSANRNLYTTIRDAAGNERGVNVDGSNQLQVVEASASAIATDAAAIEVLLTAANVDHAANEVLLGTIDADTNAIKGHVDGIETLITSTNSKIDTFDAVLDNILTKNTEIDAVLDTIKTDTGTIDSDTDAIKTATESSNTHLGNMFYDTALSVTPSDGSDLTGEPFYAVYVGTGGDLKVDMSDGGSAVTLSNVASGQLLPIMVERIYSTGTTASNIIAFK